MIGLLARKRRGTRHPSTGNEGQPLIQRLDSAASQPCPGKHPILVPVDFSPCSRAALLFASNFVSLVRAPILVLHVVHDLNNKPGLYKDVENQGAMRPIDDIAADMLAEFVEDVKQSGHGSDALASVRMLLVRGLPAQRIIEVANRENSALVIMGSRGCTGLSRLASGSVAEKVIKLSPIPVTVVKAPATGEGNASLSINSPQCWKQQTTSGSSDPHQDLVN